jgi:hypothetical protein
VFSVIFFSIKPTRCTNISNLFLHKTLHVSGSSSAHHQESRCTFGTGLYHASLYTAYGQSSILALPVSCLQTCMIQTSAECTVRDPWWWAEKLHETCRVLCKNKFKILVHLVGFIEKKFITVHGHMKVEFVQHKCCWRWGLILFFDIYGPT